jgi:hypothetical protein
MQNRYVSLWLAWMLGIACLIPMPSLNASPQQFPTPELRQVIGITTVSSPLKLYESPSFEASTVDELTWQSQSIKANEVVIQRQKQKGLLTAHHFFLNFVPERGIALLPVLDDTPDGWMQVQVSLGETQTAWIPPQSATTAPFMDWATFMARYTKRYGFNWLKGVNDSQKTVYMRPDETAPLAKVTFVQSIKVLHVRGNWMLVELKDLGEEHPIGWLKWRTEQGDLLLWPNFQDRRPLYQSPSNPINIQKILEKY